MCYYFCENLRDLWENLQMGLFNLSGIVEKHQSLFGTVKFRPRIAVDLKTCHTTGREVENIFRNRIREIGNSVVVGEKRYGIHVVIQIIDHRLKIAFRRIIKFLIRNHIDLIGLVENFAGIQCTYCGTRYKIINGYIIIFHESRHMHGFFQTLVCQWSVEIFRFFRPVAFRMSYEDEFLHNFVFGKLNL